MPNKKIKRIKVSGETYDVTDANAVQKSGDTMTGSLLFNNASRSIGVSNNKLAVHDSLGGVKLDAQDNSVDVTPSGIVLSTTGLLSNIELNTTGVDSKAMYNGSEIATTDQIPSTDNFVVKSGDTMTGALEFLMDNEDSPDKSSIYQATDGCLAICGNENTLARGSVYLLPNVAANGKTGMKLNHDETNHISSIRSSTYDFDTQETYVQTFPNETGTLATREWVTSQAEELDHDLIVTALGYEPVNKAGDTMTGSLSIEDDYQTLKISGHSIEGEHSFPLSIENIKDGGAPISIRSGDSLQLSSNQYMSLEAGTETNPHAISLRSTTFASKGLIEQCYEVDSITRHPSYGANHVIYHVTIPGFSISSLKDGMRISIHKGLRSANPNDSDGALKVLQINDLPPAAIFWRYNSMATWNQLDNVYMTLTYSANARSSAADYYGYTGTAGFIMDYTYDSGNDVYNFYDYGGYKVGPDALQPYTLLGWNENNERVMLFKQDGTLTNRKFDYTRGIFGGDETKSANTTLGPWNGSFYKRRVTQTILQACVTKYGLQTLAVTDLIYAKCTKDGRYLTCVGLTKTLPATADGYYYMLLAKPYQAYTSASNQLWTVEIDHPVLFHNGTTYVDISEVSGASKNIPEKLTLAYNLVTNQYQVTKQGVKFGNEEEYVGDYIRRQLQTTGGQAITDEKTIKDYLYFMTGVDVLPTYDTSTNQTCFLFLTSNNTCWKLQYENTGLWAYKVTNFPFATKSYVDEHGGATNLQNGTGTKALVQKESTSFTHKINSVTYNVDATNKGAAVFGGKSAATGSRSFACGSSTAAIGDYSHSEGVNTLASGNQSHAEGNETLASGTSSHSEGIKTTASNNASHAEGQNTSSTGVGSHSEGQETEAIAANAHAEGYQTHAIGYNSHAEGRENWAQASSSHAEGIANIINTSGVQSHVEGWKNTINGHNSHAEGAKNYVGENANDSHVGGSFNISNYGNQTVLGTANENVDGTLLEIGNGEVLVDPTTVNNNETDPTKIRRSTAFSVFLDGHAEVQSGMKIVNGNLQIGNTTLSETQLQKILALVAAMDVRDQ